MRSRVFALTGMFAFSLVVGALVMSSRGGETAPPPHSTPGVPVGTVPVDIWPEPHKPKAEQPAKTIIYRLKPPHCCPHDVSHIIADDDVADWGHSLIGVPEAWKGATGKGVKIAILDTGADHEHRDLKGRIVASKDFTGSRSGPSDVHGHGSHCSGIAAAEKNGTGMVGVAPDAQLIIGKVLGDSGSGSNTGIANGIDWATDQGADVISMSLGGPEPDDLTRAAIQRAVAKGVIVVCAAGNEGPRDGTVGYPGGYPEVVAVAAVGKDGKVADFSSRGAAVFVAAPGVNVRSCYPGDRFATMSGTSMATPYVAGCAALYVSWAKANGVKPSADDFKKRIAKSAVDIDPAGRDIHSGFGLVKPAGLFDGGGPVVPVPGVDVVEWLDPGIVWGGRKVKRLVIEFEPKP